MPGCTSLSPVLFQALDGIYIFLLLGLPTVYASRASRYAATSAKRVAFISLLIDEWKITILTTTCQLSSVASPYV
jgi:hypothetical protein